MDWNIKLCGNVGILKIKMKVIHIRSLQKCFHINFFHYNHKTLTKTRIQNQNLSVSWIAASMYRSYLWACPPPVRVHAFLIFHLLWRRKLHQLTGLDFASTERTSGLLLWNATKIKRKKMSVNIWYLMAALLPHHLTPRTCSLLMTCAMHGRQYTWAQWVMTGIRMESRHTAHSSSDPLANTSRIFSISCCRSSAGVSAVAAWWKIFFKNPKPERFQKPFDLWVTSRT